MRADIVERLVEIFDAKGQTYNEGVQRQRHDPAVCRAFRVKRVELVADHLAPIFWRMTALEDHSNIVESLLIREGDHAPRLNPPRNRLVVAAPVAEIIKPLGREVIRGVRTLITSTRTEPTARRLPRAP